MIKKYFAALTIFVLTFLLYVTTIYSGLPSYRDSGDLATAIHTFGIAHPTGYPFYVIIGKIWLNLLPWGNIAYKINVLSALFASLTSTMIFFIISKHLVCQTLIQLLLAFITSILFAISSPVWSLAQVAEMYTLNAFIISIIFYLLPTIFNKNNDNIKHFIKRSLLITFLSGISMTNHQTAVLTFPGVGLYLFLWLKNQNIVFPYKLPRYFLHLILLFLLGFSVNLFMPVRSFTNPTLNWGNPKTVPSFIRVLTRADYGGIKLHPEESKFNFTPAKISEHITKYKEIVINHFGVVGIVFGVIGTLFVWRNIFVLCAFTSFIFGGIFFVILANLPYVEKSTYAILEPHIVLPNMFFSILIFYGMHIVLDKIPNKIAETPVIYSTKVSYNFVKHLNKLLAKMYVYLNDKTVFYSLRSVIILLVALTILTIISKQSETHNRRYDFYAIDFKTNIFSSLPKNSILFNPDDPTAFITMYEQICMKKRTDVYLIAYFRTRWGYEQIRKNYPDILPPTEFDFATDLVNGILEYNFDKHPIYSDLPMKFPEKYKTVPQGIAYLLDYEIRPFAPVDEKMLFDYIYVYRKKYFVSKETDFFTNHLISYYSSAYNNIGLYYQQQNVFDKAYEMFSLALKIDPRLVQAYNNIGILYYQKADYDNAIHYFLEAYNLKTNDGSILYNLGLCYKNKNDIESARGIFSRAMETYPVAANELGLIYLSEGNVSKALESFNRVISYNTRFLPAIYNTGLCYERLGDYKRAAEYYKVYSDNINNRAEQKIISDRISVLKGN